MGRENQSLLSAKSVTGCFTSAINSWWRFEPSVANISAALTQKIKPLITKFTFSQTLFLRSFSGHSTIQSWTWLRTLCDEHSLATKGYYLKWSSVRPPRIKLKFIFFTSSNRMQGYEIFVGTFQTWRVIEYSGKISYFFVYRNNNLCMYVHENMDQWIYVEEGC